MPTADLAVETRGLTRDFGGLRAVDAIDLRVEAGAMYGFLGRNGAGKTTAIKMLTGILAPTAGKVSLLGTDISDVAAAVAVRRRIGVVPEDLALFDLLTGREYLTFVGRMYLVREDTVALRIEELLSVLEVGAEDKQLVLEYSHGMRKKLALAAALLPDPSLLFLDEPSRALIRLGRGSCGTSLAAMSHGVRRSSLRRTCSTSWNGFVPMWGLSTVDVWCSKGRSGRWGTSRWRTFSSSSSDRRIRCEPN